jgi:hypothetical protein
MRIDLDDRLDKDYPEPSECAVNERDCTFSVDHVCHECGTEMCAECSVGVRHQPHLSKYTYRTAEGEERIQHHCPDCIDHHSLSSQKLGIGFGGIVLGLLFAASGVSALLIVGLLLLVVGGYVLRTEYRLKKRHNDRYGISSMW